jgi:peptidyl-prolyl cis-trans isomerase SurA
MNRTVLATFCVCLIASSAVAQGILEQILVKVNGDIITKTDLEQRQITMLRQRDPNLRPTNDADLQKVLNEITPGVIVDAVDELLLVQRGRELGYTLGNDQFRNIVENIKKENKLETEEQFQAALKQENMTMEDLRRQLERQMLINRVQQVEVMGKISVTEDEVKKFYEANRETFTTPSQITLREILIAVPTSDKGINVAEDDAAKAKADAIVKRLQAGESFATIAGEISDSASKANGGLIGPISRSDLSEDLQKVIDKMKPGQLTSVVRSPRGYQIIKLESSTVAGTKTMDEARPEISDKVAMEKRQLQFQQYLRQLRAQAIIDWKNDEVKRAYELGVKQAETARQ